MSFHPYPTRSGLIFLGVGILLGLAAIWLTSRLLDATEPAIRFTLIIGLLIVLALVVTAFYWTLVVFKLDYHLNRNGLSIQWGLAQQRIPIEAIDDILPGQKLPAEATFKGIAIDGLQLGWGNLAEMGRLKFHTTASLTQSLLVVTPDRNYVISPRQPDSFLKAWRARKELGPTQKWAADTRWQWPLNIPLFNDRLMWSLIGVSALLCLALVGYISISYADLPPSLPVHFNTLGRADRIADKAILFILPTAGGIVWMINLLLGSLIYRYEKFGAYLLWSSSVAMQLCLWIAALTITA
jgi:hypothetical protein